MNRIASFGLIALLFAGCGGAPTRTLPNGSPVTVIDQDCVGRLQPLYDALRDLDSRLAVGLVRNDYGTRLGDIRVVYDDAVREGPFSGDGCFAAVQKLEGAFNEFISANNRWGDCISDTGCDVDTDALPEMQRRWATAGDLLDEVALALP